MLKRKKLSLEEARTEKKELIALGRNQSNDWRTHLAKAKLTNGYLVLGFKSFDAYLKDIIRIAKIDMSPDYARKCANAGIVEMEILGEKMIGTLREGVLRVFAENIPESRWKQVFDLAKKSSGKSSDFKFLTSKTVIKAAISLKVYKKDKSAQNGNLKENNIDIKTNNKKLFDGKNISIEPAKHKKSKSESSTIESKLNKTIDDEAPVKSLSSKEAKEKIIEVYEHDDIEIILG